MYIFLLSYDFANTKSVPELGTLDWVASCTMLNIEDLYD